MRRRWTYTMGGKPLPEPVEVTPDFQSAPERSGNTFMVDRWMEGLRGPDGADWGSRRRRAEDQHIKGWADMSDFKGAQEKRAAEAQERQERLAGRAPPPRELTELVGRTAYEMRQRGRKR
jgi:hypothetical protein